MKKKFKLIALLTAVFVLGVLAGGWFTAFQFNKRMIAPLYNAGLLEIAIDAQQLSKGEHEHVLKRKVQAMPGLVNTYKGIFLKYYAEDSTARYSPLWEVQRYYEISGDKVPGSIVGVLDSLPKRPPKTCGNKKVNESNSIELGVK